MQATCLYCLKRFPRNDLIEAFPFGKRVAYDPARMRYWVVCSSCGRWSLTPIEDNERGNLVDSFERWWRSSTTRYTSGEIGLGQLNPKLSVVRIGPAKWNEFAAWRYRTVLLARRRRNLFGNATTALMLGGFWYAAWLPGIAAVAVFGALASGRSLSGHPSWLRSKRGVCRVPSRFGTREVVRMKHLVHAELTQSRSDGWIVNTVHESGATTLSGEEGIRLLGYALPRINAYGASGRAVDDALRLVAEYGGPEAIAGSNARPLPTNQRQREKAALLTRYPQVVRIALEMSANEARERRALENELALLHCDWKEAEEIASIAETLPGGRPINSPSHEVELSEHARDV